jgi:hypothetical protein
MGEQSCLLANLASANVEKEIDVLDNNYGWKLTCWETITGCAIYNYPSILLRPMQMPLPPLYIRGPFYIFNQRSFVHTQKYRLKENRVQDGFIGLLHDYG